MSSVTGLQAEVLRLTELVRRFVQVLDVLGQEANWAVRNDPKGNFMKEWVWVGEEPPIDAIWRALGVRPRLDKALDLPEEFPETPESSRKEVEVVEPVEMVGEK